MRLAGNPSGVDRAAKLREIFLFGPQWGGPTLADALSRRGDVREKHATCQGTHWFGRTAFGSAALGSESLGLGRWVWGFSDRLFSDGQHSSVAFAIRRSALAGADERRECLIFSAPASTCILAENCVQFQISFHAHEGRRGVFWGGPEKSLPLVSVARACLSTGRFDSASSTERKPLSRQSFGSLRSPARSRTRLVEQYFFWVQPKKLPFF
jgi:hypothetical protein